MFRKRTLSHSALITELHKYHLMKARWCAVAAAAAAASARFCTGARACYVRPNIEHETFFLLYDVQVLASSLVLWASRPNLTSMAHRWLLKAFLHY